MRLVPVAGLIRNSIHISVILRVRILFQSLLADFVSFILQDSVKLYSFFPLLLPGLKADGLIEGVKVRVCPCLLEHGISLLDV